MGWVWNVLLSHGNEELWEDGEDQPREVCAPLKRINQWIPQGKLVSLIGPTYADGAGSGMDAKLFGGGYRHFDIEGFIKVVEAQDCKNRAKVQLWIKGADEGVDADPFTLVTLHRRRAAGVRPRTKPRLPSKAELTVKSKRRLPTSRRPQPKRSR